MFDCLSLLEEREQVNELMARCERISNTTLKILSSRMDTSSVVSIWHKEKLNLICFLVAIHVSRRSGEFDRKLHIFQSVDIVGTSDSSLCLDSL